MQEGGRFPPSFLRFHLSRTSSRLGDGRGDPPFSFVCLPFPKAASKSGLFRPPCVARVALPSRPDSFPFVTVRVRLGVQAAQMGLPAPIARSAMTECRRNVVIPVNRTSRRAEAWVVAAIALMAMPAAAEEARTSPLAIPAARTETERSGRSRYPGKRCCPSHRCWTSICRGSRIGSRYGCRIHTRSVLAGRSRSLTKVTSWTSLSG